MNIRSSLNQLGEIFLVSHFTLITYWFCHVFSIQLLRRPQQNLNWKSFHWKNRKSNFTAAEAEAEAEAELKQSRLCIQINNGNAICHTLHFDVPFSYPAKGKGCPASCRQVKNAAMLENDSAWNERMQMEMKTPLRGMTREGWETDEGGRGPLFKYAESATALRLGREQINPDQGPRMC